MPKDDVVWLCRCGQSFASGDALRVHVQRAARDGRIGHDLAALHRRPNQEGIHVADWLNGVDEAVLERMDRFVDAAAPPARDSNPLWVNIGRTGLSVSNAVAAALKTDPPRFAVLWDADTHALVLVPDDRPMVARILTARRPRRAVQTSWRVERVGLVRWIRSRCACLDRPGVIRAVAESGWLAPSGRPVVWVTLRHGA